MERLSGLFGFFLLLGIAFALSTNRKSIRWKTVFWGITLQLICALVVLVFVALIPARPNRSTATVAD